MGSVLFEDKIDAIFGQGAIEVLVDWAVDKVGLYEDQKRYEDDVEATIAILKGHEHEHGLTVGQVLLRDVHLHGVYDQENDGET